MWYILCRRSFEEDKLMTKVMVIKTQSSIRQRIAAELKKRNILVEVVKHPERAADEVPSSAPDLIVLDMEMRGVDGLQLMRNIRKQAAHVPIILLSSASLPPFVDELLGMIPATSFLRKPFESNDLLHCINNLIRNRDMEQSVGAPSDIFESLMAHMLPELHDPHTGRLDAGRIGTYLRIPLASLARAIGKKVAAVHKNPAAVSLQDGLAPIARSIAILFRLLGSRDRIVAWLNSPHPDLEDHTPLSLILDGKANAVAEMLEAVLEGQPS
jgi:CheY-like chemotaxis protein